MQRNEKMIFFPLHSDTPSSLLRLPLFVFYDSYCQDAPYLACALHFTKNALTSLFPTAKVGNILRQSRAHEELRLDVLSPRLLELSWRERLSLQGFLLYTSEDVMPGPLPFVGTVVARMIFKMISILKSTTICEMLITPSRLAEYYICHKFQSLQIDLKSYII